MAQRAESPDTTPSNLAPGGFSLPSWMHPRTAFGATVWYVMATLAATWPLAAGLSRDIPWDLGDSLLNSWILAWNAEHFLRALQGDLSSLSTLWHGNIFHPAPYVLGYSELLIAQSVQILPIYAATDNVILCYNLLFLSSYVVSGLGMYLLARELTGDWRAAFVTGMLYGFAMYRVGQGPHLQSLSSQWLPFVFWCLRRYFDSRRVVWIAWSIVALTAHNLSNGYYMLFGAVFLPLYVLYEMADRGLWRRLDVWGAMATIGVGTAILTLPTLTPYLALRAAGEPARPLAEVIAYSADIASYFTAAPDARLWGSRVALFLRPEGELFPGFTLIGLAGLAAFAGLTRLARAIVTPHQRAWLTRLLFGIAALAMLRVAIVFTGVGQVRLGPILLRVRGDVWLFLAVALAAVLGAAAVAPAVRRTLRGSPGPLAGFALGAALLAAWLSLGPIVRVMGAALPDLSLYQWLYAYVPGFDGLRVPARLAMFVTFFLAVAAGYGARDWLARSRTPLLLVVLLSGLAWAEGLAAPLPINASSAGPLFKAPPARVSPTSSPPALYRFVRDLPPSSVVVEFPFGDTAWETRHVYHAAIHGKRLVNGYSGGFPASYSRLVAPLSKVPDVDGAWELLEEVGATHAIVHDLAFEADRSRRLHAWLLGHGARLAGDFGTSRVFSLFPPKD